MKMGNVITTAIWVIVGVVAIGLIGSLKRLKSKKNPIQILKSEAKSVNEIKFQDIVAFFKAPEIWSILKANKNILPVALKEKEADGTVFVMGCLFDEEKDDVVSLEKFHLVYKSKSMDAELIEKFGDEDMLVLR